MRLPPASTRAPCSDRHSVAVAVTSTRRPGASGSRRRDSSQPETVGLVAGEVFLDAEALPAFLEGLRAGVAVESTSGEPRDVDVPGAESGATFPVRS